KANASKHNAMSYGRMASEQERLETEIKTMLHKAATSDTREDHEFGGRQGNELPEELSRRETRLAEIREAMAALEAEAQAKGAAGTEPDLDDDPPPDKKRRGKPRKQRDGVPEDKAQRNFTDPDSRI